MIDLQKAINADGFGSGARARDLAHEKATRRKTIPNRKDMNALIVSHSPDALVASLGYDVEDGNDYHLNSDGEALVGCEPLAGRDARVIAALWNAYRDGDLVWRDPTTIGRDQTND